MEGRSLFDEELPRREGQNAVGHGNLAAVGGHSSPPRLATADAIPPFRGSVSTTNVLLLLERQGYRCALTGRPLTPESAALDHILPVCRGGEHRIENAQVLHKRVNRAKGTMTNEEFVAMCREVLAHAASRN